MKRRHLIVGLGLPLVLAACLWQLSRPQVRPNVLLITVDTLRADHLGAYGYERPTSPNIDAMAADSVLFEQAFANASLSGPSHASIMTSLDTPLHGVMSNGITLAAAELTLGEVMRGAGYETAMFVSDVLLGPRFGFDQGFDSVELLQLGNHDADHKHPDRYPERTSPSAVFDAAISWLDQPRQRPFFLWLHALHPHESYEPPAPYDTAFMAQPESHYDLRCGYTYGFFEDGLINLSPTERLYSVALYDGEIAYVDAQIGRLLAQLAETGLEDNTVVVLTADHGEMLLDHPTRSLSGHGRHRFDAVLQVPLIIKGAQGARRGHRVAGMVGGIDIAPTVLELAGVRAPDGWRGSSLVAQLRGGDEAQRTAHFVLTTHSDQVIRSAARTTDWKLIVDSDGDGRRLMLFDLKTDPIEAINLGGDADYAEDVARLAALHDAWFQDVQTSRVEDAEPTEAVREMLERAGYLRQKEKQREKVGE